MRVYIEPTHGSAGPKMFKNRLIDALRSVNVDVVTDGSKFDIELCFIHVKRNHNKPRVLRLDGCYYDRKRMSWNAGLEQAIRRCKTVIFQSAFSQRMCKKLLRVKPDRSHVIHNGIDLKSVESVQPNPSVESGSFVSCAYWRSNKRPNSTIRGFLSATQDEHLYMIGDLSEKIINPRVHYVGGLSWKEIIAIMKSCKYQIHLCHVDSCPNAVIEGLACGLNVLCTNLGGTPELVQSDGVVLNVDKWNFKPVPNMKFDNVDPAIIGEGIRSLKQIKTTPDRADLDIKPVAESYAAILRGALS